MAYNKCPCRIPVRTARIPPSAGQPVVLCLVLPRAGVYSYYSGPIRRMKQGYIPMTDQSDTGSVGSPKRRGYSLLLGYDWLRRPSPK
eukprot:6636930-Pyramimonas_sp.AAC.2